MMLSVPATRRASRGPLLAGAAMALTLFLAASPAAAQSSVSATGDRALVNRQTMQGADALVIAEDANLSSISPTTTESIVHLDANSLSMSARGNQASGSLDSDGLDASHTGSVDLRVGAGDVRADGAMVIANRQTAISNNIGTDPFGSVVAIGGGAVTGSTLSATDNAQLGSATANGAVEAITVTNHGAGSAGIVSYQTINDGLSQSSGRAGGIVDIGATTLSSSQLTNSMNLGRGIGIGNDVSSTLNVKVGAIQAAAPPTGQPGMMTATSDGSSVRAQYGILTNQAAAGLIKGRAGASDDGPAFHVGVSNVVVGSSIANDGNSLDAAAYGDNASNSLGLEATSIGSAGGVLAAAPMADINDVQAVKGTVTAFTLGTNAVALGFGMADSSVSASGNTARAVAAGNLASDAMSVKAVSVDTGGGGTPVANALVTSAGGAQHDAAFGVQTVQDFATSSVSATQRHGATAVDVAGPVSASTIVADDNVRTLAASGNSASSRLGISASDLLSSGAVNLLQAGNGSVTANLGSATDPVGTRISATSMTDGRMSVSGNAETATTLGNDGSASLSVDANRLASSGASGSAGMIDDGYGAAGTYVLSSNQKLGAPDVAGAVQPVVTSTVVDQSGIAVSGDVSGSSLAIDRNSQRANAVGNRGANRVDVSATSRDGAGATALSSSQYGQATIAATSKQHLDLPGTLASSSISASNNANTAYAAVNSVDNGLIVKGVGRDDAGAALAASDQFGPPTATGGAVLSNQQFASGTLIANATSEVGNGGQAGRLAASQETVAGNSTLADASANRALNNVSLDGAGVAGTSLVNTQISAAPVRAVAASDSRYTANDAHVSLTDSAISFDNNAISATARGNAADNMLTLATGTAASDDVSIGNAGSFSAFAKAPVALHNQQNNLAAVTADTSLSGASIPLNGAIGGSQLGITGNTMSAAAYGNSATNEVAVSSLGGASGAALVNMQTNSGVVAAFVTGGTYRGLAGPVAGSPVALSGNQITAAATGNLAASMITVGH